MVYNGIMHIQIDITPASNDIELTSHIRIWPNYYTSNAGSPLNIAGNETYTITLNKIDAYILAKALIKGNNLDYNLLKKLTGDDGIQISTEAPDQFEF